MTEVPSKLSRRDFLKLGWTALGVGAAAELLASCSSPEGSTPNVTITPDMMQKPTLVPTLEDTVSPEHTPIPTYEPVEPNYEPTIEPTTESPSGLIANNPPENFEFGGGRIEGFTEEQLKDLKYWEIFKVWKATNNLTGQPYYFMDDAEYKSKMDEFMVANPDYKVNQIQDRDSGKVLTYLGDQYDTKVLWAVTEGGLLADSVPGDTTGNYHHFMEIEVNDLLNHLEFARNNEDGNWYMAEVSVTGNLQYWFIAAGAVEGSVTTSWQEVEKESVWRFIAPPAEKNGELIYEKVTNWLAENKLRQEDVKRLMTADGAMPLGRVFPDYEMATEEYGTNRCYSFLLGGVISLDEIYPGHRLLVMFNPDNPDNVNDGGQVLGFVLLDNENDASTPSIGLIPSDSVLDVPHSRQWETTLNVSLYESDFIDVMEAGLGLDANEDNRGSWYGLQMSLGIQHLPEPGTYNSLDGVITGVDLDKNDDGVFDKYSGRSSYAGDILEMNYYYTLAMPDSYVDENMRNVILSHALKRYD